MGDEEVKPALQVIVLVSTDLCYFTSSLFPSQLVVGFIL